MKYKKLITALLIGILVLGQGYWTPVLATMPSEEVQETTEVSTEASTEVSTEASTEAVETTVTETTKSIGAIANSDGTGYTINDFVARLYLIVLGRSYDYDGYSYWVTQIQNGEKDMAEVALGFFYSEEFLNKNLDNETYVTILYATYLNRKPDTDGYWNWVNQLEEGASRRYVLDGFSNSVEFNTLCAQYATVVEGDGTTATTAAETPTSTAATTDATTTSANETTAATTGTETTTENYRGDGVMLYDNEMVPLVSTDPVERYVERLYKILLGRNPETSGLKDWANQLKAGTSTGTQVARGFVLSEEFRLNLYSDEEFVTMMYQAILGRNPDSSGFQNWVNQLNEGYSRTHVFLGFTNSVEFRGICSQYGINPGYVADTDNKTHGYIFIGDSRFLEMDGIFEINCSHNYRYYTVVRGSVGCYWLQNTAYKQAKTVASYHPNIEEWTIVCNLGVNDLGSAADYVEQYQRMADDGFEVVILSVNPADNDGNVFTNEKITRFNSEVMAATAHPSISYLDCYSYLQKVGYACPDGLHYDEATYEKIYRYLMGHVDY